jgi:predicted phage baseplate assembly protein
MNNDFCINDEEEVDHCYYYDPCKKKVNRRYTVTPMLIENEPGKASLFYRVGTYSQFKSSMLAAIRLQSLNNGMHLADLLTTRADDDMAIALMDAWATVADVLTFYQERIANEGYLRTATERRSILELARAVGYELRPGVAASTFLAFTLEDSAQSIEKTIIDIGTKVQSLPAQGQLPQVFETIEKLEAMPKWNNLRPRLTKGVQEDLVELLKQKKEKMLPRLIFKGINTGLKPGDGLLFTNSSDQPVAFRIVSTVEPDPLLKRTTVNTIADSTDLANGQEIESKITTINDNGDQTLSPSSSNKSSQFDLHRDILARPWTESDLKAYVIMNNWSMNDVVKAVNYYNEQKPLLENELIKIYAFRIKANFFGHNAPLWTTLPVIYRINPNENNQEAVFPKNWEISYFNWNYIPKSPDNDDSDFKHLRQILKEGFQIEWKNDPNVARENENKKIKLSTTNTDEPKVSIELNNEPLKATRATLTIERNNNTPDIRKDEFIVIANNTKGTVKLYDKSWPGSINTDSQGKSYGDGQIYLDNKYQGILQSPSGNERASRGSSDREENNNKQGSATSWIVLKGESDSDAAAAAAYKITKVNERTMADFSLSSAVTGLVIDMIDDNHDRLSKFRLRESTAYVLSEKLELAEQSISHPVGDNTNSIMLDRMVDGLTVGQLVAISGQLVDQPGVVKNEIAVLSDIVHFEAGTTFTTLYFTKNLVYRYRRDTVTLNANVIRATHGETKQEVIGSWDQSSQQQQQQQPQMQQQQQRFVLKQKPLTYMYAPTSRGVKSTLELRVNEILWKEVDRLYDLKPTDHAYITRTDDDGQTYVVFGDGIKGARPASGMENIVAKYRVGIGTVGMLNESQITLLMNRPLGVRSVINPIAPAGAADPEDLDNARQNASLTVLAMDRIVSFTDCENFVRSFAGIGKAQATLINSSEKKTFVIVTIMSSIGQAIEPTSDLYKNLLEAIDAAKDPLIQIGLGSFNQKLFNIEAKILVAKDRRFENVKANVEAALYNVFSFNSRQFSQSVTLSEIIAIIEKVEGVVATDIDALYLFDPSPALLSWKNVLDGDEKFVDFLEKNVKIDWIEKWKNQTKHEVNRSIDQNQIAIFFEKNSLYCTLIRKKNRVRFDIVNVSSDSGISSSSDDSQYEFVIKQNGDTPDKLSISKMRLVKSIPAKRSSPTKTNFGGLVQPDLLTINPKGVTLKEMEIA